MLNNNLNFKNKDFIIIISFISSKVYVPNVKFF